MITKKMKKPCYNAPEVRGRTGSACSLPSLKGLEGRELAPFGIGMAMNEPFRLF